MRTCAPNRYIPVALSLGLCLLAPSALAQDAPPDQAETEPFPPKARHSFDLSIGAGEATYEEHVTIQPIDSEWTSDYVRLAAAWISEQPNRLLVRVQGAYWWASDDTETWRSGGTTQQENRLEADGFDLRGEVGYGLLRREEADLNGWLGLGVRGQDFVRDAFQLYSGEPRFVSEAVGETYAISYFSAGVDGWINITEELRGGAALTAGWVFMNEADNDLVGRVDGDGGYLVEARISMELRFNPRHAVVIGVFLDEQSLDGATVSGTSFQGGAPVASVVEWPDNTSRLLGIEMRWLIHI